MTQREAQILQWIRENPMISQQELADRAGITRSSVAVHISNLMKKGYIGGKGYIIRTQPYAVVVGGVNMDIGGTPFGPLVGQDSNPGRVRMSLGADGVYAADHLGGREHVPCFPARMVNTTGCGDAFMAALAWSWLEGLGLDESARAGLAASAIAMEGEETINPELDVSALRERAGL